MNAVTSPRIFFSYAHESEEHKELVVKFCGQLRQSGLDAWMDAYDPFPPQGWPQWMLHQIKNADFVLVVCSESLLKRFEGTEEPRKGKGAKWEGAIVTQGLYDAECHNRKFVPIVVSDTDKHHIPTLLRPFTSFDISDETGRESLYRLITNQPAVIPPAIGGRLHLSPKIEGDVTVKRFGDRSSANRRVQANISFTTLANGWTVVLKVVNVSEIPLYLESPTLELTQRPSSDSHPGDSLAASFVAAVPTSGPLLPTQQRIYFLPLDAVRLIKGNKLFASAVPSIRVATAVGEELRLDDDETAGKIRALLGIASREGKRQFEVRFPLVMGLVHKRCTDQAHAGFKVYPPTVFLRDPSIAASDDVIDRLADLPFRIEFADGVAEVLSFAELIAFVHQQIFIKVEIDAVLREISEAGVEQPVHVKLDSQFCIDDVMHPEFVKVLLSKIAFESTASDTKIAARSTKRKPSRASKVNPKPKSTAPKAQEKASRKIKKTKPSEASQKKRNGE